MKIDGLARTIGAGLFATILGGCINTNRVHTHYFAEISHNPLTKAVDLNVSDAGGIRRVEIYKGFILVDKYNLEQFGNPTSYLIETRIHKDGNYWFKIIDKNGEMAAGTFTKKGEKVSPEFQGCF